MEESSSGGDRHTQEALRELFDHVSNMPESAKKKKLIRQVLHPCYEATLGEKSLVLDELHFC